MSLPPYITFKPSAGLADGAPAIFCIQEWWGLNDEIKGLAQILADKTGAEVYVPDLYKVKSFFIVD